MIKINIQSFGGRGARSGIKNNGILIGVISGIKSTYSFPLPDNNDYPDFPDPDYSNYKLKTKDENLINAFNIINYKRKEHYNVAKKYIDLLNINKDINFTNINTDSYGYVRFNVDINGIVRAKEYNLNIADTRRMEYKVKTMIHEGFHAKLDGRKYNQAETPKKTRLLEETRTEMAAMYLAHKLNGYDYIPSYSEEVSVMAKKYIQLPEYSDCKTIYDLGRKFYKERITNNEPNYMKLSNKIKKIEFKDFKNQEKFIVNHREECYNVLKDSLFNYEYYSEKYIKQFENSFDKLYKKIISNNTNNLINAEKTIYNKLVAYSMAKEGI